MMQNGHDPKERLLVRLLGSLFIGALLLTGCSTDTAENQPRDVLVAGTPRDQVIAKLGAPIRSGEKAGGKADVFGAAPGYCTEVKIQRVVAHVLNDVFSVGLYELLGGPDKPIACGPLEFEVFYDQTDRVRSVVTSGGEEQGRAAPESQGNSNGPPANEPR